MTEDVCKDKFEILGVQQVTKCEHGYKNKLCLQCRNKVEQAIRQDERDKALSDVETIIDECITAYPAHGTGMIEVIYPDKLKEKIKALQEQEKKK